MRREDVVAQWGALGFEVVVSTRCWVCAPVVGLPAEPTAEDLEWCQDWLRRSA